MPTSASQVFGLTQEEARKFLRIIATSQSVQRHYDLFLWLKGELQEFLPHDILISASGDFATLQLEADIVSALPGVRTAQLCHCNLGVLLEDLYSRWVDSGRRALFLGRDDVLGPLGRCTCVLHRALGDMHSILVHGVQDMRCGNESLYIALNCGSFTKGRPKERLLLLLDPLVAQIDIAFRRVSSFPLAACVTQARGGKGWLDLSMREQEILEWVCRGKTNAETALALEISPFTVKNHMQRIFRKIGVSNRTQAATKYKHALQWQVS